MESFHALLKREWIHCFKIRDYDHAYQLVFEYISLFILGPEGGLAQQEIDFLVRKEVTCCSLGENILRWETAALLVAGLHSCLGQSEHREGV